MEKANVLIFPADGENALEIFDSLRYSLNIEVFGASGKSDHASYLYPKGTYFEGDYYINQPDFFDSFNRLLISNSIAVVIPTHDTVALFLAENRDLLAASVLTADAKTAKICREKRKTFQLFRDFAFCPKIYDSIDAIALLDYPIFIKPNIGEGGKGSSLASSPEAALEWTLTIEDPVLCEYLPGEEVTIDCFTNRKGELLFSGMRSRERIQNGIAHRSRTLPMDEDIYSMAAAINNELNMFGAWFFQAKKNVANEYRLLEVSCRQAGTMTLYRHKGINFALLGIFELNGIDTSFVEVPFEMSLDRSLQAIYKMDYEYDTVYVDFDDTLIIKEKVNVVLMQFLYQCVNEAKQVVLLTRHSKDLSKTLDRFKLPHGLFDEIYQLGWDTEKTNCIVSNKAIFIDNSYQERKKVFDQYGIPVFDVDAITALLSP